MDRFEPLQAAESTHSPTGLRQSLRELKWTGGAIRANTSLVSRDLAGAVPTYDPAGCPYKFWGSGVGDRQFVYDGDELAVEYLPAPVRSIAAMCSGRVWTKLQR
jgi:hypothetical protein